MKKGISPIVAVVLLIAIAVIAAVGLYFWVGGLATKQPTPSTPKTIATYAVVCNSSDTAGTANSTIMVSNTSPPGQSITAGSLRTSHSGGIAKNGSSSAASELNTCPAASMASGAQETCVLVDFYQGSGTASIYGSEVGSATVTC